MNKDIGFLLREKYPGLSEEEGSKNARFRKDALRLAKGEPVAYVIGNAPFLGCRIDLRHRTLIPRPETEHWTERTIREIGDRPVRCLDVFCGSGCVGIAVLAHCPHASVVFADIDPAALRQTRLNLRLNGISSARYLVKKSDALKSIPDSFDLILANPPYVPLARRAQVAESVRRFEPPSAVFGGRDGLIFIRRLLRQAGKKLHPGGRIRMEFDPPEKSSLAHLFRAHGFRFTFEKDQYGKWRTALLSK